MKISKLAWLIGCLVTSLHATAIGNEAANPGQLAAQQAEVSELASGLSEFEWFRIFPYIDRSYTLSAQGRFAEATLEVERARRIVPNHIPLVLYHADLLIAQGRQDAALTLLADFRQDTRVAYLIGTLAPTQQPESPLTASEFLTQLAAMPRSQRDAYAQQYLNTQGAQLNYQQIERMMRHLAPLETGSMVRTTAAEYMFAQREYAAVNALLQQPCLQNACSPREREQLIQAKLLNNDFSNLSALLTAASPSEYDDLVAATVNRMLGADDNTSLISLLVSLDQHRPLTPSWGVLLFQLASNDASSDDHMAIAHAMAERYQVGCLNYAEFLLAQQQISHAQQILGDCRILPSEESRFLVLAQRANAPELLQHVTFSQREVEQARIGLLVDQYTQSDDLNALIRTLENYAGDNLSFQRSLANAYLAQGRTNDALRVSEHSWRTYNDPASFDQFTFVLASERRFTDLLTVAQHPRAPQLANAMVTERVLLALDQQGPTASTQTLNQIAQRWPASVKRKVAMVLVQRGECGATESVAQQLRTDDRALVDSYCASTPQLRLAALRQKPTSAWTDDDYLRAAVLAYDAQDYAAVLEYTKQLSAAVEPATYQSLVISTHLARGDVNRAKQTWLGIEPTYTSDEAALGVQIALQADDLATLNAIDAQLQRHHYQRISLPIRLRIAELEGNLEQQLSLYEGLAEESPNDAYYVLAQAYIQQRRGRANASAQLFERAFNEHPSTRTAINFEQAAFSAAEANQQRTATAYLRDAIDSRLQEPGLDPETLDRSQRLYRQVRSPWRAQVGGWVGQSTNVSEVTGNDFQADYFFSTLLEYDIDYHRGSNTRLTGFANLLSAGDDFFFDNNTLDIGMQWQPWQQHVTFLRVAYRNAIDDGSSRWYARASTDLLAGLNPDKPWLQRQHAVTQSLYVDWIFFPDEQTSGVYARYQPSWEFAGYQQSFYRFAVYPFVQYQWTNDTFAQERLTDTRAGLGVTWRQPWGQARYSRWHAFSDIGLEWQRVIDSQIAGGSDNALLLRFAVYF